MTSALPTHDLLLALAGRVDDDLLGWARELTAAGAQDRAIDLLTATLIAERTALPAEIRAALVAAGRAARTILDADVALAAVREDVDTAHEFDPTAPAAADETVATITAAADELLADHPAGAQAYLTWRRTPAGSATGPLPHPVVLVELADDTGAAALADRLAATLGRQGVSVSVEVYAHGAALPGYHELARRAARPLVGGPDTADDAPATIPQHSLLEEPAPAAAVSPTLPAPAVPAAVSAWWAAADLLAPPASAEPLPAPDPARDAQDQAGFEPAVNPAQPTGPLNGSADDPLNGPLRQPLLAPLLDLTIDENDPLGVDDLFTSRTAGTGGFDPVPQPARSIVGERRSWRTPEPAADPGPAATPAPARRYPPPPDPEIIDTSGPYPVRDTGPATAASPPPVARDTEPSQDQAGAARAVIPMPTPGRDVSASRRLPSAGPPRPFVDRPDRAGAMPARPAPSPAPRDPTPPPAQPRPTYPPFPAADPEPVTPVQGGAIVDPRLGLRPDSVERLSPTDRALLARLQNELGSVRPPQQNPPRPGPWRPRNTPPPNTPRPRPQPVRADPPDVG